MTIKLHLMAQTIQDYFEYNGAYNAVPLSSITIFLKQHGFDVDDDEARKAMSVAGITRELQDLYRILPLPPWTVNGVATNYATYDGS